jgi:WD40 repeat protein
MQTYEEHPAKSKTVIVSVVIGIALCLLVAFWPIRRIAPEDYDVITAAFSADGKKLLGGTREGEYLVWDVASGRMGTSGHTWKSSRDDSPAPFNSLAFAPNGKLVVYAGITISVSTVGSEDGSPVIPVMPYAMGGAAVSPDSLLISAVSSNEKLWVWKLGRQTEEKEYGKADAGVYGATAFSPDGKRLVSAGHTLRMIDVENGREIWSRARDNYVLLCVAFRPDGKVLATGSQDTSVRLWSADDGKELSILRGHQSYVDAVSFSPDGKKIVSWARDGRLFLWDLEAHAAKRKDLGTTTGGVAFSPDGRWIASGGPRKTVEIRDALSGKKIREFNVNANSLRPEEADKDKRR